MPVLYFCMIADQLYIADCHIRYADWSAICPGSWSCSHLDQIVLC